MLEGKIVLVAGANREIGRQIAPTLGREGVAVIVNYDDSAARIEEVVKETEAARGKAEAVQYSVSGFESCDRMMTGIVSRYGRLDILVNNAGIARGNLLIKMSEEGFDAVISTNLKGILSCIKHTSRQMLEQKTGRIVNISSVSGVLGNAGQANYCAAKAGVTGIIKSAVRELANKGITVDTVAPGFIATEITGVLSDSVKVAATGQILMKHFGNAQDIAETVASLVSDKAGCITGQVLSVGGRMAM